ncbi:MAG: cellulase family glycosylhydrolase [Ginsengibacter sp.]
MGQQKSFTKSLAFLFLFLLFNLPFKITWSQGFLKVSDKKIVDEKGENVLLRGMGFGGWMLQEGYMLEIYKDAQQHSIRKRIENVIGEAQTKEFYNAWLNNFIRKIDIDSMHAWGFNSVRLPMHYNLFTLPVEEEKIAGKNTWLNKGFALTDSLLKWCAANHMYLILDLHAAPGGQGNDLNISDRDNTKLSLWQSEANREKTIALWKKLAERYKNEKWIGGYDILNEPNWGFADSVNDPNGLKESVNGPLKKLLKDITTAIRGVDKNHIIIIEGNGWGNNYSGILPPWDKNMVLSFHKYWDFNKPENIQRIIDARDKYDVPVWLGETGENSNVWYTEEIRLLEKNNIGWAMWPLKKIGSNNPLEIKSNTNYDSLKNYMNGEGIKPAANTAYMGLMELASATKFENNIFHKDVIDALFRQPFSDGEIPYKVHLLKDSIEILAADYDLGRNGVAYFDMDTADYRTSGVNSAGNRGRVYRNDGVDIYKDSLKAGYYYVGNIENNEWLSYTIDVSKSANYTFKFMVVPGTSNGEMSLSVNGKLVNQNIVIPSENNLHQWQPVVVNNIILPAGKNLIKIFFVTGGFNLESIQILN